MLSSISLKQENNEVRYQVDLNQENLYKFCYYYSFPVVKLYMYYLQISIIIRKLVITTCTMNNEV